MSDKENVKAKERILAFKLSRELRSEEVKLIAGGDLPKLLEKGTHGWKKGWTRPGEEPDQNEYVVDYEH